MGRSVPILRSTVPRGPRRRATRHALAIDSSTVVVPGPGPRSAYTSTARSGRGGAPRTPAGGPRHPSGRIERPMGGRAPPPPVRAGRGGARAPRSLADLPGGQLGQPTSLALHRRGNSQPDSGSRKFLNVMWARSSGRHRPSSTTTLTRARAAGWWRGSSDGLLGRPRRGRNPRVAGCRTPDLLLLDLRCWGPGWRHRSQMSPGAGSIS